MFVMKCKEKRRGRLLMKNESCKTNLLKALESYEDDDIVIKKLYIYFLRLIKAIHRE